jgi:hypothetical protein
VVALVLEKERSNNTADCMILKSGCFTRFSDTGTIFRSRKYFQVRKGDPVPACLGNLKTPVLQERGQVTLPYLKIFLPPENIPAT